MSNHDSEAHMDHPHTKVTVYETAEKAVAAAVSLAASPEARLSSPEHKINRSAGSYIGEFLFGLLTLDEILERVENGVTCCMDDRCQIHEQLENHRKNSARAIITSHDECGAAGLVTKLARENEEYAQELRKVLAEAGLQEKFDAFLADKSQHPDTLGKLWAQALVAHLNLRAGADVAQAEHIGVEQKNGQNLPHFTDMMFIGLGGSIEGHAGEKPFFYTLEHGFQGSTAHKKAATLLLLAAAIAQGNHSDLDKDATFWGVIVTDASFNEATLTAELEAAKPLIKGLMPHFRAEQVQYALIPQQDFESRVQQARR